MQRGFIQAAPFTDPETAHIRGVVAGVAPYTILGMAVWGAVNWGSYLRMYPQLHDLLPYLVACLACYVVLAGLMWRATRAARIDTTGLIGIVTCLLASASTTLVAWTIDDGIRFAVCYAALMVVGAVWLWPRPWHFVAGTACALLPPTVLLYGRGADPDLHDVAGFFLVNTVMIGTGLFVMFRRVERRTLLQAREVLYRATHDGLTGVLNRTHWRERAAADLGDAHRLGLPASILLIDIDQFKQVNDTHGHEMGDVVLGALGLTLQRCVGRLGRIGRLGGDEFVVVLPGQGLEGAGRMAVEIQATFRSDTSGILPVSLSIGLAERVDAETLDQLIARADGRMYDDKRAPRPSAPVVPLFDFVMLDDVTPIPAQGATGG